MPRKPEEPTSANESASEKSIVTFKGFDADLSCRGHKFEIGGTYSVSGRVKACSNGFHACGNPWDILKYYPIVADGGRLNRYAEVCQFGDTDYHHEDSKVASASITTKAELQFPKFVSRLVSWMVDTVSSATKGISSDEGYAAQIGSSGYAARIEATGENAVIACAGPASMRSSSPTCNAGIGRPVTRMAAPPASPTTPARAHGLIAMIRRITRFGAAIEMTDCARIALILESTKWEGAPKRSVTLELDHVEAVRTKVHEMSRSSLALGTALQWELMLRQRDVIGEWEPYDPNAVSPPGPKINGRVWANGLTWASIDDHWILTKRTTKTGSIVRVDLTLLPMAIEELQRVPADKRIGPIVIDETAGRPYAENRHQQEWRKVANAAGVPRHLFNMDARSGAATEADDAGASRSDLQRGMGHSDPKTTTRYVRGDALPSARRVATLRVAHRAKTGPERR